MAGEIAAEEIRQIIACEAGTGSTLRKLQAYLVRHMSSQSETTVMRRHMTCAAVWYWLENLLERTSRYAAGRAFAGGFLIDQQVVRHKLADAYFLIQVGRDAVSDLSKESTQGTSAKALHLSACVAQYTADAAHKALDTCVQLGGASSVIAGSASFEASHDLPVLISEACDVRLRSDLKDAAVRWSTDRNTKYPPGGTPAGPAISAEPDSLFQQDAPAHAANVSRFILEDVMPGSQAWRDRGFLPRSLFKRFADLGLFCNQPDAPSFAVDFRKSLITTEELVLAGYPDVAVSLMLQANSILPLLAKHGTSDPCRSAFVSSLRGETIVSLAATEPAGGSDLVNAVRTTCAQDGECFVLNGEKQYITNAPIADFAIVLARVPTASGALSFNAILVPTRLDGVQVLNAHQKLGLHASPTGGFRFSNCRVPINHLIGVERRAITYFTEALHGERVLIAGAAVAAGLASVSRFITHSTQGECVTPDRLLSAFAAFVCIRTKTTCLAEQISRGTLDLVSASMAKASAPEILQQYLQSMAHHHRDCFEEPLSRWWTSMQHDARILSIFAGTSETMRDLAGLRIRSAVRAGGSLFELNEMFVK